MPREGVDRYPPDLLLWVTEYDPRPESRLREKPMA